MKILGIETSCDETAASVVEVTPDKSHVALLSATTATSLALHAATGGIIPEVAARNQIKDIIPVIYSALEKAKTSPADIDAIAVTFGPGLIGSLLVGVETAKTLSYVWNKPLIPVNHLFGHLYANFIRTNIHDPLSNFPLPQFPALGLIISGGHTDLVLMKSHTDITWLGGTRDDAAGEAFDKIGRMLGLAYPAGPVIENLAKNGNPQTFQFPRPLMYDKAFDFSFSGLKTAVLREVEKRKALDAQTIADICRGVQDAISDVIVYKTLLAAEAYNVKSIMLGGGVAANETLRNSFQIALNTKYKILNTNLFVPSKSLCTDNAAMIASAALFQGENENWQDITAHPTKKRKDFSFPSALYLHVSE